MKRPFRTALAATTVAALTGGLLTIVTAAPASAAPAKYADDFNGDGFRDYAVFSYGPEASSKGGCVLVTFGTAAWCFGTAGQRAADRVRQVLGVLLQVDDHLEVARGGLVAAHVLDGPE